METIYYIKNKNIFKIKIIFHVEFNLKMDQFNIVAKFGYRHTNHIRTGLSFIR